MTLHIAFSKPPEEFQWSPGLYYRAVAWRGMEEHSAFLSSREQFLPYVESIKKAWKEDEVVIHYKDNIPPLKELEHEHHV